MDILEALGILAGVGVAGYIGYEYISKSASTSTTSTTGATPSVTPIGQATPYETTGHLEDPLINELLNTINSLEQQISSQSSPTTNPSYNYYNYYTGGSSYPSSVLPSSSSGSGETSSGITSTTTPTITSTPTITLNAFPTGNYNSVPFWFKGWYNPLPTNTNTTNTNTTTTTSTITSTTTPNINLNKNQWYNPVPPPSIVDIASQAVNKLITTGANVNTQQASQIQNYNPFYQLGTPTTASSKIGSAITGAVVTALGGPQSKLAQTYLNVTRPFVTTTEAIYHPQIQAFNQAISSAENVAKQAESTVSQTAQQVIPQAQKVAQSVVETVGNSALSAVKSVESAFGSFFSHF